MEFTSNYRRSELSVAFAIALLGACAMAALAVAVPAYGAAKAKPAVAATADAATAAEPVASAAQTPTSALERIRVAGKIVLGYRADAAPMSYRDASGRPVGYAVTLCNRVADELKRDLGSAPTVEWVAVESGFADLQEHRVDMICDSDEVTQANREKVSFSIPIFPGGVSAVVRRNAPDALKRVLEERPAPYQVLWRGTPPPTLEHRTYSALVGSPTMAVLQDRITNMRLTANIEPVADYDAGIAAVRKPRTDVLFGDREKVLEAVQRSASGKDLQVLTRHFTFVALALALPRNDDDYRLAVDRALSNVYADPQFGALYTANFGTPDADTVAFFRSVGVPVSSPVGPTK
jgi:ABC-type amino acid transport substrate-binding protein